MTARVFKAAEIVVERRHLGMFLAVDCHRRLECPAIEPRAVGKAALIFVQHRPVVQEGPGFLGVPAVQGLRQRQGFTEIPVGLRVATETAALALAAPGPKLPTQAGSAASSDTAFSA